MTYDDIITAFTPTLLNVADLDLLTSPTDSAGSLIYGEIHGIRENADVIYTLAHRLGIKRIAVEARPSVQKFIDTASRGEYDFSLVDDYLFDGSIVSIEVAKTLATLLQERTVQEIVYIDKYFDNLDEATMDDPDSPQKREEFLAQNILALDDSLKTLCIMGQWHTQPQPVELPDSRGTHLSALYRVRQAKPNVPFVHSIYRSGQLFNDGRTMDLPLNNQLPQEYTVTQLSPIDFKLCVPNATKISLPAN